MQPSKSREPQQMCHSSSPTQQLVCLVEGNSPLQHCLVRSVSNVFMLGWSKCFEISNIGTNILTAYSTIVTLEGLSVYVRLEQMFEIRNIGTVILTLIKGRRHSAVCDK